MIHTHGSNAFRTIRPACLALAKAAMLGLSAVTAAPVEHLLPRSDHLHDEPEVGGGALWVLYIVAMVLVLLGGAFAGLTIAFMGLDGTHLQVLSRDTEEPQHKNAKRVLHLLNRGKHWVLVTLLLSNVMVNETLPVVLDRCFGGGVAAVVGSTVLIVIFGEVVPQSICVRFGLPIGGYMSKPVLILMYLMAPIAWPTAKLLDYLLGEDHGTVYKKSGLKTLVTLHRSMGEVSERLNEDEVTIISAVLDLKRKPVEEVMTPMDDVYTMSEDTVLDEKTIDQILDAGYSRIPIHQTGNSNNFVGMLLVKILITYDPEDCKKVRDFALATLPETRPETSCLDIINFFQEGKSHMVLISEVPGEDHGAMGVVTLEDVIEELIGEEIIDESDVYVDVHKAIRRSHPAPKARIQRKDLMAKDAAVKDGDLIGFGEGENGQAHHHKLTATLSGRSEPPVALSSSPKTTLLMRRSSAGQDGQWTTVPVKANYSEMKDHLKHLGPSNPASNPKSTRVSAVKIKPGLGSVGRSNLVAAEVIPEHPGDADGADERTSLLRPAAVTSKDGIQALHQTYTSPQNAAVLQPRIVIDAYDEGTEQANRGIIIKEGSGSQEAESPTAASGADSVGSLPSQHSGLQRQRTLKGTVRSGSITENVVDTGGIRKVVLEATSSGDVGDFEDGARIPVHLTSQSRSSLTTATTDTVSEDDEEENIGPTVGSSKAQGNDKKKSRRKKRKGGK